MRTRWLIVVLALFVGLAACGGGEEESGGGGAATVDPSTVSGTVTFSGWQASPEEGKALEETLAGFAKKYPNIKVSYQPVAGEYPAAMLAKFTAKEPPDLFYVDSAVAPEWIDQGVLEPLDATVEKFKIDTGVFYPGYLDAFKGPEGDLYGLPKDGNTLAMAYNTEMFQKAGLQPPANWDELVAAASKLKASGVETPYCLGATLDRALAFVYQNGGALLTEDKSASALDQPAAKDALRFYLGLFKQGAAKRFSDLGADWCGKAFGDQKVAAIFEGGWLDSFMASQYPKVEYQWAPMPQGKQQATLGFTVSYSIGKDSKNKDAAGVLLSYLTGPEGMTLWTKGGVANPSRKDVPAAPDKKVLVDGAAYAKPWSFTPGFSTINDAFNNAMTAAVEAKSDSPDDVVAKTNTAIQQALAG
jgi:multiple sugar transport system substrate-binding protein